LWYDCLCDCGKRWLVPPSALTRGRTRSCGCWRRDNRWRWNFKHGATLKGRPPTPEYAAYQNMKARCLNPKHDYYSSYGGRGISICSRWMKGFGEFFEDMGMRPTALHSVERRDVNGHYCPENCYWGTEEEQAVNKRNTLWVVYHGERLPLATVAKRLNTCSTSVWGRIQRGWPTEQAFETPIRKKHRRWRKRPQ